MSTQAKLLVTLGATFGAMAAVATATPAKADQCPCDAKGAPINTFNVGTTSVTKQGQQQQQQQKNQQQQNLSNSGNSESELKNSGNSASDSKSIVKTGANTATTGNQTVNGGGSPVNIGGTNVRDAVQLGGVQGGSTAPIYNVVPCMDTDATTGTGVSLSAGFFGGVGYSGKGAAQVRTDKICYAMQIDVEKHMADAQEGGIVASAWLQQELNRKCPIDIGVLASTLHWSKEEEADKVQACEHEAAPPPPAQKHAAHAHFHSGASCPDGYEFKTVTTTFAGCFRPGETPAAGQPVVVATPLQAPAPAVPK